MAIQTSTSSVRHESGTVAAVYVDFDDVTGMVEEVRMVNGTPVQCEYRLYAQSDAYTPLRTYVASPNSSRTITLPGGQRYDINDYQPALRLLAT